MSPATLRLVLVAACAWTGAAVALLVPGLPPAWLALAAALAAWLGRTATPSRRAWLLLAVMLAFAALGARPPIHALGERPGWAAGRLAEINAGPHGWVLVLDAGGTRGRLFLPHHGDPALDTPPPDAVPGAHLELPLDPDAPPGRRRGLSWSTVRVTRPPSAWDRVAVLPDRLRGAFREHAERRLCPARDDPVGGLLLATVAGDDRGLDARAWRDLRASGLAHIAVVSGFNVTAIALAAAVVAAPLGGRHHPRRRWVVVAAAVVLLVLLPDDPPVRRAGIAVLIARGGTLFGRGSPPAAALALAVALLLAFDPALAGSLSFALTVAATAGLVLAPRARGVRSMVLTALAPFLATWPILVLVIGRAAPWCAVANLLAAPAAVPVLAGGWITVLLPDGALLGWATWGARLSAAWVLAVAREVAAWPGSGMLAAPAGVGWAVLLWALLVLLLRLAVAANVCRPAAGTFSVNVCLCAAAVALAAAWAWPLRPVALEPGPRLVALAVGQGQAVLLAGHGAAVLVDAADDRTRGGIRAALDQLRQRGFRRLDALVLTHADRDHAGGAAEAIATLRPREVMLPASALDAPDLREALAEASLRGIAVRALERGSRWSAGPVEGLVLHPPPGRRGEPNATALVMRARFPGFAALLPADVDRNVEGELARAGMLWPADVLVAGHHGARTCTSEALLARVRPAFAAISCGAGNPYGHPHPETLARLAAANVRQASTADGAPLEVSAVGERRIRAAERLLRRRF